MATTIRIPPASRTYDIRQFVQPGESLVRDGSGPGDNSKIFQRANDILTSLAVPSQISAPGGRYILGQSGTSSGVPYGVFWKSLVGLVGESEASTVLLSDATSTPIFSAGGTPRLFDCLFQDFTIDCAAQTKASYAIELKGMYITDMLRPRWNHVTIKNAWATGLGCDFLQDFRMDGVTVSGNGRGLTTLGLSILTNSGGSGVGIGTGRFQYEAGVINGLVAVGNARGGLFGEQQTGTTYYSRGVKVIGALLRGNGFGLQDCGWDGLDADITAVDNTYAGVLLDGTYLAGKAGINGRISGRIDRNGSASTAESGNVVLGNMTDGNYHIGGVGSSAKSSPRYGVVTKTGAVLGPRITIDLAADRNGAAGVAIQGVTNTVRGLTIAGSARSNGQDSTATRREGVSITGSTDQLTVSAVCMDDQATPTQTYGLRTAGGASMTRGKLTADVRFNATGAWVNDQAVSADTLQSLIGAAAVAATSPDLYASDPSALADQALPGVTAAQGTSTAPWGALLDAGTGGAYRVASGFFRPTAGSGNVIVPLDTTHADGTVKIVVGFANLVVGASGGGVAGIAFRIQDASNYWRLSFRQVPGNGTYTVQKLIAGAITTVITTTTVPQPGDIVRMVFSGSALSLYVNGVLIGSATDAQFSTATKHGLWGNFTADPNSKIGRWSYSTATT